MAHYLPTAGDLAGLAAVWLAALVLMLLGRVVTGGRALPEIALPAGWGALCLVLTVWGAATPLTMRVPAVLLAATGLLGLAVPRLRPAAADWKALGRIAVLALPILVVMAHARPSQVDTFLNLLPNAAYLVDHGFFPADGRPDAHSFLPAAPYNQQLAAFVASLVAPGFPANALIGFNVALQLAAGLLLARLVAKSEDDPGAVPSWGSLALGVLLATAFNPGFAPRIDLSSYGEPSVAVALACAGFLVARRAGTKETGLLALVLAALVSIKPDSVALTLSVAAMAALLPPAAGETRRVALARCALAVLPALVLYFAWRWYVPSHFASPDVELTTLPLTRWQLGSLPAVLRSMLGTVAEKVPFFALLFAVIAAFLIRRRRGAVAGDAAPALRAAAILSGVAVLYTVALLLAYVAHFTGEMAADAHSYFRYNTHLSLLLMVAATWLARDWVRVRVRALSERRRRLLAAAMVVILLACPPVFLNFLRFDLEAPQQRAWLLAGEIASRVADGDRLMLILPGDNGSLATMIEGALRLTPPRRNHLQIGASRDYTPETLGQAAGQGYQWALLSCAPAGVEGVPAGQAALFQRGPAGWRAAALLAYPPTTRSRWSRVVSDAPLCLGG